MFMKEERLIMLSIKCPRYVCDNYLSMNFIKLRNVSVKCMIMEK